MKYLSKTLLAVPLIAFLFIGPAPAQDIPRFRIRETNARDFFKRGLYFFNNRNYVASREYFYRALNISPSFHLARRYLGDAHYYAGEWNAALEQWEYLNSLTGGSYPRIKQRSELLRFGLNKERSPGEYVFLESYDSQKWRGQTFARPAAMDLDRHGNLYFLSYEAARIFVISPAGDLQRVIRGSLFDRMSGPLGLDLDRNEIYVSDYKDDRVRVFNLVGRELLSIGKKGSGPGEFRGPMGLRAIGNHLFVADSGNRRIQKFDRKTGRYLNSFNGRGSAKLIFPTGMAYDGKGIIYVADNGAGSLKKFDIFGNYRGLLRSKYLSKPRDIAISRDRMIIADEENGVIFRDRKTGVWKKLTGLRDDSNQPLHLIRTFSTVADPNGPLYIADYGAHRIIKTAPLGLRYGNLDVRIERVDSRSSPNMAVFASIRTRTGQHIPGLSRRNIRLYENGNRVGGIRTDNIRIYNQRTNIVIVKENSFVFKKRYDIHLPAALHGLFRGLRISDRIRVIRAGERVRKVYSGLMRHRIIKTLRQGETGSMPNIGKGLYEGITSLLPELGPRYVILILSGKYYPYAFNQYSADRIIQYARSHGIRIYPIMFKGERDRVRRRETEELYRRIARDTKGLYISGFDATALNNLYAKLRKYRDERYLITYKNRRADSLAGSYADLRLEATYMKTMGQGDGGYFVPEK